MQTSTFCSMKQLGEFLLPRGGMVVLHRVTAPVLNTCMPIAVITVAPAVKYSFVSKGMQTRRTGQHKAKLTLSPRLHVKPLITVITAIAIYNPGWRDALLENNVLLKIIMQCPKPRLKPRLLDVEANHLCHLLSN